MSAIHPKDMKENTRKSKVVFASCNRQNLPQDYWREIAKEDPTHFLWMGDAVYTKKYTSDALRPAYDLQLSHVEYQDFVNNVNVDGVWDDHDYGVNDGGVDVKDRPIRQAEYLRFLNLSHGGSVEKLSNQEGIYHDLDVDLGDSHSMKIIFLDTRYFRSKHYLRSLGEFKFPLSAIISSAIRGAYSVMGYGRKYEGEILGAQQWSWLEKTLAESKADIHVIISSIQVLTSNPVFESWGHYPKERKRLLELIGRHDPHRTVLLSGDVHLGELSTAEFVTADGKTHSRLMEVTSSGLTHTCSDNPINRVLCPIMMRMFYRHRLTREAFYTGRNYGSIEVSPLNDGLNVTFAVKSLESDMSRKIQLQHSLLLRDGDVIATSHPHDVKFADFPVLTFGIQLAIYILLLTGVVVVIKLYKQVRGIPTLRAGKRKRT